MSYESRDNKLRVDAYYNKSEVLLMCVDVLNINTKMHLYFILGQLVVSCLLKDE